MTNLFLRWFNKNEQQSAEALMKAFAENGKPALLEALVQKVGDDLYHYLLSQTDPALAADICQSTWLKVMEKRKYYQDRGSFKAWLFTMARNQMLDHMRQSNRWQPLNIEGDDHISQSLESKLNKDQELAQFNKILARLPMLQKEAFILQQEGFSLAQIAEITGDNAETIKSRIRYAKNHFHQLLNLTQEEAS